jgi:hypothetical protein
VDDYLAVHVHKNTVKKERIWYPGQSGNSILTGAYTNSPHVLVRYDVTSKDDKFLTLVLSQYKKLKDLPYTLSIFATEDFNLSRPLKDLEHCIEVTSAWTESTAGGRYGNNDDFGRNPKFAVQIPDKGATVELRLSTASTSSINGMLAPVSKLGQGIDHTTGLAVLDTGKYRHGFAATPRVHLKGGAYVLIVSNFHQRQEAVFQVKLSSSSKINCKAI